jgi:hypothetical protein
MIVKKTLFVCVALAVRAWAAAGTALDDAPLMPVRVPRVEIAAAMQGEVRLGYNVLATANGARFTAHVILRLASLARDRNPKGGPLLLDHTDYFDAFVEAAGVTPETAPTFIRIARDYAEDQLVEFRRSKVIDRIVKGRPDPALAVNVVAGWPDSPGVPDQYSYDDLVSKPPLRVFHKRVTSYRLVDYGDVLVFDDIHGIGGRATGGLLGFMFKVIGDGRAVRAFSSLAADGIQVTRTTARKSFVTVTQTATVFPDGRGEKGVPPGRPDLEVIEKRLSEPFEATYQPIEQTDPAKWR